MEKNAKKNLITYGIFFGIIVFMTISLIFSVLEVRESWKKGLAIELQNVLSVNHKETFVVEHFIETDSLISTSSAVYSLLKVGANKNEKYYGVIIRVPSIVGPVPAIFICKKNDISNIHFVGYAGDFELAKNSMDMNISNGINSYWKNNIKMLIEKAIQNDVN